MGLDQFIYKILDNDAYDRLFEGGVFDVDTYYTENPDGETFGDNILEMVYWRKQYWIQDYFDSLVGGIENCWYYEIHEDDIRHLLKLYDKVEALLKPYYHEGRDLVTGVPDWMQKKLRELFEGEFDFIWSDDEMWCDYDYMYYGIKSTREDLQELLYEMEKNLFHYVYHGWW